MRRFFEGRDDRDRALVEEFRPSKARQRRESRRLRPVAVLPGLVLLVGACAGIMTATDRSGALFVYLGLFGVSGAVAAIIVAIALIRNRAFVANARVRISAGTIEYANARGRVVTFERGDPSLRALLTWVLPSPNSEGINLPSSLILFVSDQTHSIRLRGSDWEVDDLETVVGAATTRADPPGREERLGRRRRATRDAAGVPPVRDLSDARSAWTALSALQVNEVIPGTMRVHETHPLTFAMLIGFGSVAAVLLIVVGVALWS